MSTFLPMHIAALTREGLEKLGEYLRKEEGRAVIYGDLAHLPAGKFLQQELVERRDMIRGMYRCISTEDAQAAVMLLSCLQAYERECDEWLNRITQSAGRIEELRMERDAVRLVVEQRKKREENGQHFVPHALRRDEQDATGRSGA